MGFFDFLRRKPAVPAVTHRLVWFELQVMPAAYRFAIVPRQPILVGLEGTGEEKGVTLLIRYDHAPQLFNQTVERVDSLLAASGIATLPPHEPGRVFADGMEGTGTHLRFARAGNTRWAGRWDRGAEPPELQQLVAETKALAREILRTMQGQRISGEQAEAHLDPDRNLANDTADKVMLRVKVGVSGQINVNRAPATLEQLGAALDALKAEGGTVWYHRENPHAAPSPESEAVVKQVLDAVMSRQLPVRLLEEDI